MEAERRASGIRPGAEPSENALVTAVTCLRSINPLMVSVEEIRMTDARVGEEINRASLDSLESIRHALSASESFTAYLAVLHASLANAKVGDARIPSLISSYIRLAVESTREYAALLPYRWAGAGRHAARLAMRSGNIQHALSLVIPLREAAAKLAPTDDHLVPLHADFLAICIEAKSYGIAAQWARRKRLQIERGGNALEASDVLLTYYYSAVAFTGVKEFRLALHCARIALAVPASSAGKMHDSAIATYKKFILLNILVNGGPPAPLKFSSYNASRVRNVALEYTELAVACDKRKLSDVKDVYELHRISFERDSNLGLVKQVVKSLARKVIKRLTTSFVTMRIEDVATRAGLSSREEAEQVLLEMIGDGSIRATLDAKDGVVRLVDEDDTEEFARLQEHPEALDSMNERMQRCIESMRRLQLFRDSLISDPIYAKKEANSRRQRGGGRSGVCFGNEDSEMATRPNAFEAELLM